MSHVWTRYLPDFIRERLAGRLALQNAISNTGWLLTENILRMGVGFFINAWIIRYLGPDRFGQLSYSIAFVGLFAPIAQLGLDAVVVRNMVSSPSRRDEILGSAFALKLGGGALTVLLTMGSLFVLRPADHLSQALVGIMVLGSLFQSLGVIDFWFQSRAHSKYPAIARSAACLTIYAVKVWLILGHAALPAFAWVGLCEVVLSSAGLLALYLCADQHLGSWRPTRGMARELLRDSWLLMVSDLLFFAYLRLDRIMLGQMSGAAELGVYSVAALASEALFFIPISVSLSLFPAVLTAKTSSMELFQDRLQRYYQLMVFLGYAVALPVTLCAGWLVPLVFGTAYGRAAQMLVVLSWAGVFINLILARSYFLTAMNWTRLHFIVDILGGVGNLALNLYLIPRYGGMGAALASLLSYSITAYALCFVFKPLAPTGIMMTKAILYPKFW